jgi:hypothetical protein
MTAAHVALAWLAATSVVAVLVLAVLTATGRARGSYRWLDATLLAQAVVTGLASALGVASFVSGRPPVDALHVVYGAVATLVPLGVRAAAQGRDARTIGRWVAVAAVVAIGATVRSFMTGR